MIKKMIKGEKGFTLVELLAVIVILGIIAAIAIPSIGKVIDKAEEGAEKSEITMVEDAARLYDLQNDWPNSGTLPVSDLIDAGYLDPNREGVTELTGNVTKSAEGVFTYTPAGGAAPETDSETD